MHLLRGSDRPAGQAHPVGRRFYTYAARGIGPKAGFLVGWFYVAFGMFLPGSLLILGGWFVDGFLDREIGFAPGWWFWGLIFAASSSA